MIRVNKERVCLSVCVSLWVSGWLFIVSHGAEVGGLWELVGGCYKEIKTRVFNSLSIPPPFCHGYNYRAVFLLFKDIQI